MGRMALIGGLGAVVVGAGLVAGSGAVQAQPNAGAASGAWLHVRVEDKRMDGGKSSKVSVNLPLPLVEVALQAAPEKFIKKGHIHFGHHHDLSMADLRKMWQELKNAGDTDFVTVEEDDETVRVGRKGDVVQVRVQKLRGTEKKEEVVVDVPVALMDIVLASDDDQVDAKAVIRELAKRRGDIVRVTDNGNTVRVWIDESSTGVAPGR
jgi:hypothetical protein